MKYNERTSNLNFLYQLQEDLQTYALHGDICALMEKLPVAARATAIARISGAEI